MNLLPHSFWCSIMTHSILCEFVCYGSCVPDSLPVRVTASLCNCVCTILCGDHRTSLPFGRYSIELIDLLLQLVATASRTPPPIATSGPGQRRHLLAKRQSAKTRETLVATLSPLELQQPFDNPAYVTSSLLAMEALCSVYVTCPSRDRTLLPFGRCRSTPVI